MDCWDTVKHLSESSSVGLNALLGTIPDSDNILVSLMTFEKHPPVVKVKAGRLEAEAQWQESGTHRLWPLLLSASAPADVSLSETASCLYRWGKAVSHLLWDERNQWQPGMSYITAVAACAWQPDVRHTARRATRWGSFLSVVRHPFAPGLCLCLFTYLFSGSV